MTKCKEPLGTVHCPDNRGDYVSGLGPSYDAFVAPVNLPQGAVVTNVRYQFFDNSAVDTWIWLYSSSSVGAPQWGGGWKCSFKRHFRCVEDP